MKTKNLLMALHNWEITQKGAAVEGIESGV